jgi:hypothetical protein
MTYILIMVLTFTYDRGGGVSASQGTYGTLEACELARAVVREDIESKRGRVLTPGIVVLRCTRST